MLYKDFDNIKPYIIAEVGQNHQGDLDLAIEYIKVFSAMGANAIKFQSRDNKFLFDKDAYNKPYNSENSFGDTYGKHREKLELSYLELKKIKRECKKNKVDFISTPFDEISLKNLIKLDVDAIKIASFDLGNLQFINEICKSKKTIILSTGGGSKKVIRKKFILLHCVSEYPCTYDKLGLEKIAILKKKYPQLTIGLSDHFNGILSGPVAFMNGARVFEKHVTLNRTMKGTDHNFALEPNGFKKFVRDIHRTKEMFKSKKEIELGKEKVFSKLGKSLFIKKSLKKGKVIKLEDLSSKIYSKTYIPVRDSYKVIGKKINKDLKENSVLHFNDLN